MKIYMYICYNNDGNISYLDMIFVAFQKRLFCALPMWLRALPVEPYYTP